MTGYKLMFGVRAVAKKKNTADLCGQTETVLLM